MRKCYVAAVISQFEGDPEGLAVRQAATRTHSSLRAAINPFDTVAVLLLYHHYKDLINGGSMWLSLHNFCMLVVLHLKVPFLPPRPPTSLSSPPSHLTLPSLCAAAPRHLPLGGDC